MFNMGFLEIASCKSKAVTIPIWSAQPLLLKCDAHSTDSNCGSQRASEWRLVKLGLLLLSLSRTTRLLTKNYWNDYYKKTRFIINIQKTTSWHYGCNYSVIWEIQSLPISFLITWLIRDQRAQSYIPFRWSLSSLQTRLVSGQYRVIPLCKIWST